ncbi:MAG: multifunctional CCA tRNA nucleotidyl transferase/2'3'-cyclic phosphodiesterase/2'nucleotidase/phosphatase [Robiginitomaculum sp.]|nr:MAG: multifunctional CCA tRNA nucleotidyl transferase/2'3'-cyclic phosphodiesterase/2'nucleotidase/phosphatase [Robiginitomaculum sp.]
MQAYLVGGAVRDLELGKIPKDQDWVVVGATQQEMLDEGFSQVGADFPVFLHPETGDEYALARREKSTGKGYHDFETDFGRDVTLEEDLFRRDLTINSMAMTDTGQVIDPYGGLIDLNNYVLRATSAAFKEDPVRVLRLARFRAQLGPHWKVETGTMHMCNVMGHRGDLTELTAERVSKELFKALESDHPRVFFDTLDELGALEILFPVIFKMKSVKENLKWHPEGNTYEHTMLVLEAAKAYNATLPQMYNALVHDFGKTLTDPKDYPSHHGHENTGVKLVNAFSDEMRVPAATKKNSAIICRYHMHMHRLHVMRAKTYVKMFDGMGAANNSQIVSDLLVMGVADMRGKLGSENAKADELWKLISLYHGYRDVKFMDVCGEKGYDPTKMKGERCKQVLYQARTVAIDAKMEAMET